MYGIVCIPSLVFHKKFRSFFNQKTQIFAAFFVMCEDKLNKVVFLDKTSHLNMSIWALWVDNISSTAENIHEPQESSNITQLAASS